VAFYTAELVIMVNKLHQCHVIHGDIKPDNIMIVDIRCVFMLCILYSRHHRPNCENKIMLHLISQSNKFTILIPHMN